MKRSMGFVLALLALAAAGPLGAAEYRVYFLGGQSNMEGYGHVAELPDAMAGEVEGVRIFTGRIAEDGHAGGGVGLWAPLEPGHGAGYRTDGESQTLSDRFGPELPFGRVMQRLEPDATVALVKYAKGGTALMEGASGYGNWDPEQELGGGINQYDHALATLRNALAVRDIDGDGVDDTLVPAGIVWMQGEADAEAGPVSARAYGANLKRMMNLLRAALRQDDLPVVVGRIIDSGRDEDGLLMDHSPVVQRAQAAYAAADRCAELVDISDGIGWTDDWHYDTDSYLRLGRAFAEAMHSLHGSCP